MILFLVSLNTLVSCVALFYVWRAARSQRRLIEMWMNARQAEFQQLTHVVLSMEHRVNDLRHTQLTGDSHFCDTLSKLSRLIRRPDPPLVPGPPAPTAHERLMKDDD